MKFEVSLVGYPKATEQNSKDRLRFIARQSRHVLGWSVVGMESRSLPRPPLMLVFASGTETFRTSATYL